MYIPPLSKSLSKGACGRVGILGGSSEYAGAPYFAGMASLLVGSDLVYIFTHEDAAPIIKSYSPDLIVYPILNDVKVPDSIPSIIQRLSALVVGPGLSCQQILLESALLFIKEAKQYQIPLIIDADGLRLVEKYPKLFSNTILTPNYREFSRLLKAFDLEESSDALKNVSELALKLDAIIICKGERDILSDGKETLVCDTSGGLKRVGGLGDILAGTLGTLIGWTPSIIESRKILDQSFHATRLVRSATFNAFSQYKRSMTASNVLSVLGGVVNEYYDK